ncbi:hypothetical protein CEW46_31200 [Bacillus cereus]|nr:hypothetical protein CEW46_31200 [Bacillus cereus]
MTNQDIIKSKLADSEDGYVLGCYNKGIDNLPKEELDKVLEFIDEAWIDVEVILNGVPHIVEIETVGTERDLHFMTKEAYQNRYGNKEDEDED